MAKCNWIGDVVRRDPGFIVLELKLYDDYQPWGITNAVQNISETTYKRLDNDVHDNLPSVL